MTPLRQNLFARLHQLRHSSHIAYGIPEMNEHAVINDLRIEELERYLGR